MDDLIARIRAAIDLAERHADKDLALAAKCSTPPSTWTAWYGHNLPYSEIRMGEGESAEIVIGSSQHDSDAMLVSRAVRSIEERAKAAQRQVAAHRKILDEHEYAIWPMGGELCTVCREWPCTTIRAVAEAYGIEP